MPNATGQNTVAANTAALEAAIKKLENSLSKANANSAAAIAAPTAAQANANIQAAVPEVKKANAAAVRIGNMAPGTPVAEAAAAGAVNAGVNLATAANAAAAQGVGAAAASGAPPGSPAANAAAAATKAATAATNAAKSNAPPAAANAAAAAGNAAAKAAANASPEAKRVANTIKKNLMNNPLRKPLNTNANRGKVAANILNTKFNNGGYLNKMGAEANFTRAYTNLMNNKNLSNQQKNVVKRIYFSYMLKPNSGGKRRANLSNNLTAFKTFNNYKAASK